MGVLRDIENTVNVRTGREDFFDVIGESHVQHPVDFVQNDVFQFGEIKNVGPGFAEVV